MKGYKLIKPNSYYIHREYIIGDKSVHQFWEHIKGTKVKLNLAPDVDFFWHNTDGEIRISEGMSGFKLGYGDNLSVAILCANNKLRKKKIIENGFEHYIKLAIKQQGLSPRYKEDK